MLKFKSKFGKKGKEQKKRRAPCCSTARRPPRGRGTDLLLQFCYSLPWNQRSKGASKAFYWRFTLWGKQCFARKCERLGGSGSQALQGGWKGPRELPSIGLEKVRDMILGLIAELWVRFFPSVCIAQLAWNALRCPYSGAGGGCCPLHPGRDEWRHDK